MGVKSTDEIPIAVARKDTIRRIKITLLCTVQGILLFIIIILTLADTNLIDIDKTDSVPGNLKCSIDTSYLRHEFLLRTFRCTIIIVIVF